MLTRRRRADRHFGSWIGQVSYHDIYPPRPHRHCDSDPELTCQLGDRNTPPATDGDHHMIRRHPHPGYLPARQVGDHSAPGTAVQVIDGLAAAGRRDDGIDIDAVDYSRRPGAARTGDALAHDTRNDASWSSSASGR